MIDLAQWPGWLVWPVLVVLMVIDALTDRRRFERPSDQGLDRWVYRVDPSAPLAPGLNDDGSDFQAVEGVLDMGPPCPNCGKAMARLPSPSGWFTMCRTCPVGDPALPPEDDQSTAERVTGAQESFGMDHWINNGISEHINPDVG